MELKGIDVSTYQGYPDWAKVKSGGIDFAVIKCGQGKAESSNSSYFADSKFAYNITNAAKAGIKHISVYYYFTARTNADAKKEAEHCLELIAPYKNIINGYVAVDVESKLLNGLNRAQLTEVVRTFYNIISASGYECIVYTNPNFLRNRLNDISDLTLWLALWRSKSNKPIGYSRMRIWQWGASAVPGIKGNVDSNLGYFDVQYNPDIPPQTVTPSRDMIKAGTKVRVENPVVYGTSKRFKLYHNVYDVISVSGDRAVIGIGNAVTAAIDIDFLETV